MPRLLGKLAPRHDIRTLRLADYMTAELPTPPPESFYQAKVPSWPMYLNDSLGDCVCAAAGHMIEQWTAYGATPEVTPEDTQILTAYEQIGGYVPGNPTTDNGCDMLTALNWWRNNGIAGHKILAFAAINPQNPDEVQTSIHEFGNCYLGIQLPVTAQGQTKWEVVGDGYTGDSAPGSWGGHCIPQIGYSRPLGIYMCVTWGEELNMTPEFLSAYADEAYAVITHDWLRKNGESASGFNLTQLQADLKEVGSLPLEVYRRRHPEARA